MQSVCPCLAFLSWTPPVLFRSSSSRHDDARKDYDREGIPARRNPGSIKTLVNQATWVTLNSALRAQPGDVHATRNSQPHKASAQHPTSALATPSFASFSSFKLVPRFISAIMVSSRSSSFFALLALALPAVVRGAAVQKRADSCACGYVDSNGRVWVIIFAFSSYYI